MGDKKNLIICAIFPVTLVCLGITVAIYYIGITIESEDHYCFSVECIKASKSMLKNMKLNADPCDDFYTYACGKFIEENVIPDGKFSVSVYSKLRDQLGEELKDLLAESIDPNEIKPFQDLKRLNKACLNTTLIEEAGLEPISEKIKTMGGCPVLGNWNATGWTWEKTIVKLSSNGFNHNAIFTFDVIQNFWNSTQLVPYIYYAKFGLDYNYLILKDQHEYYKAYRDYQVDVMELLGSPLKKSEIKASMAKVLEFEYNLAEISHSEVHIFLSEFRNVTDLYKEYNYIDWLLYFNAIMPENVQLNEDDRILNLAPNYFRKLENVLKSVDTGTLANYLIWRAIMQSEKYLNKEFTDRIPEMLRKWEKEPRAIECALIVRDKYPHALGALYVRKYFKEDTRNNVKNLTHYLLDASRDLLKKSSWMNDNATLEKLNTMKFSIAYENGLLDDQKIVEYYSRSIPVKIDENNFFESTLQLSKAKIKYNMRLLRKPFDNDDWSDKISPAVVNAYYFRNRNKAYVSTAILKRPIFHEDQPNFMNFAAIGSVIGHEITHGFDDLSMLFDVSGNLNKYWNAGIRFNFDDKVQCMIDQYNNYIEPVTGLKFNGDYFFRENRADNVVGGIIVAYKAYLKWVEDHGEEKKLPGLKLTPKQLFWVAGAQECCGKFTKFKVVDQITPDPHAPWNFRVIGPLSNSIEFAKDFKCSSGSNMNPVKKCKVW